MDRRIIYTSSFRKVKGFLLKGISISRYTPKDFVGPEYVHLMPNKDMLTKLKQDGDWAKYTTNYFIQLEPLKVEKVIDQLFDIAGAMHMTTPILCCYEDDPSQCHRHLVAIWLHLVGKIQCKELEKADLADMTFRKYGDTLT